ncbi:hypothetical protein JW998_07130 [candidate division KSB1 bacterium]|nr:hypothetical protein [candidate division KSB1 bacterium]
MRKSISILVVLFSALELYPQATPDPHRFDGEIATFRVWDAKNALPDHHVLFVGSSTIRMWKSAEMFPGLPIVNRGFGGAHFSDLLFFVDDVLLKHGAPACIVLYCGDNDVASGLAAEQVIENFQAWWTLVQESFPSTPLIYLPIKPCPSRWNRWEEASRVNKAIFDLAAKNDKLYYADTATPMLRTGAPPATDLFIDDLLHLSDRGYEMWTNVLRPLLDDILTQNSAAGKM